MARVKRGVTAHARHKKILAQAKGYKHGRKNIFRLAKQAIIRAGVYQYRDRKVKKREFRASWIIVLNAAAKSHGISYSQFMLGLKKADITLNRKVLAELAQDHPEQFETIIQKAKASV
jgi:large subunit ribosomal protein L20